MFVKDQAFISKIIAGLPVCASNSQFQHNCLAPLPVPYPFQFPVFKNYLGSV